MKILWLLRRSLLASWNGQLEWGVERVVGKDNIAFYGNASPTHDQFGEAYYPETFNIISPSLALKEIVRNEQPDIIVIDKPVGNEEMSTDILNNVLRYNVLREINIPKVAFMNDVHTEWANRLMRVQRKQLDMVFLRSYGGGVGYRIKREICPVGYSPCFATTRLFKDAQIERNIHVYLSGCMNVIYPHRMNLLRASNIPNSIKYVIDRKKFTSQMYRMYLNKSLILAFGTGMMKYPVLKIFEGMAGGALAMFDLPYDYKALRFEPDVNMVELPFSGPVAVEKFKQLINDEEERQKIVRNATDLIQKYHDADARARQLVAQFEETVNAKNEGRKFDSRNVQGEAGRQLKILEEHEDQFNRSALMHKCIDGGFPVLKRWYDEANMKWNLFVNGRISEQAWEDFISRNL